jgi:hypothetical protein
MQYCDTYLPLFSFLVLAPGSADHLTSPRVITTCLRVIDDAEPSGEYVLIGVREVLGYHVFPQGTYKYFVLLQNFSQQICYLHYH